MSASPARPVGVRPRSYESVARWYDAIARVYSRGRIGRAKAWQAPRLNPGERVLYVGIGTGEDALMAAQRGARVTGIDLSAAMLRRAGRRFERAGLDAELIRADFFEHASGQRYDVVALNFFLSVLDSDEMERALIRAIDLLALDGRIFLADFAALPAGPLGRLWSALYYWPVDLAGALLGLAAVHAPHDCEPVLARLGFAVDGRARFALWRGGPGFYEALVASERSG